MEGCFLQPFFFGPTLDGRKVLKTHMELPWMEGRFFLEMLWMEGRLFNKNITFGKSRMEESESEKFFLELPSLEEQLFFWW